MTPEGEGVLVPPDLPAEAGGKAVRTWRADAALAGNTLIWGSTFVLVQAALKDVSPILFLPYGSASPPPPWRCCFAAVRGSGPPAAG